MNKDQIIKGKINLNPMQKRAEELKGKRIVLNAPTGSGKTEAILLNLNDEGKYFYFLPTITSCIFMYRRLVDLDICNIRIRTSVLTEEYISSNNSNLEIIVMTPDPIMIKYLENERIFEGMILDELDNYPVMVKSALMKFIKDEFNYNHIVIASATLDEQLMSNFINFKNIEYNIDLKLIKHKTSTAYSREDIYEIIKRNPDKKIGIIRNSIKDMRYLMGFLEDRKVKFDYLHSNLTDVERMEAEDKLYNGNFKVFISNDIISYSVDVDFDILIMDLSDKANINLQRIGRNNRYNKRINYTNLYFIHPNLCAILPFIDDDDQMEEYNKYNNLPMLTYNKIRELKSQLKFESLPTTDYIVNDYWKSLKENGYDKNLREAPIKFRIKTILEKEVYDKTLKKKIIKEIETSKTITYNGEFPWAYDPYLVTGEKRVIHLNGWHHVINSYDYLTGIYNIEEYNKEYHGRCYELSELLCADEEEFEDKFVSVEDALKIYQRQYKHINDTYEDGQSVFEGDHPEWYRLEYNYQKLPAITDFKKCNLIFRNVVKKYKSMDNPESMIITSDEDWCSYYNYFFLKEDTICTKITRIDTLMFKFHLYRIDDGKRFDGTLNITF